MEKIDNLFDKIVKIANARGFVFNASSIYGGLRSSYDYGPLGTLLKNNISEIWWKDINQDSKISIFPIDTAIIQSTDVWKASGHLAEFTDPMVDHKPTGERFRADQVPENLKKEDLTEPRQFNLMFETNIGPVQNANSSVYLRPETAQGIFVNFENVQRTMRAKLPFGIANIGKSFRNEITPGQFIFRTREFEQMEIEYFCKKENENEWFDFWVNKRLEWYKGIGIPEKKLRLREHEENELAHYAKEAWDIEYEFPFGWSEVEGIHNRTDFDLGSHTKNQKDYSLSATVLSNEKSNSKLAINDPESKEWVIPYVIEPSAGVDRGVLALLNEAYTEERLENDDTRIVLKFNPRLAPIKVAVIPLKKNNSEIVKLAHKIKDSIQSLRIGRIVIENTGNIGKSYRKHDEIGTPICITVDFDSLENEDVTIRDRDTMEQIRQPISKLSEFVKQQINK